MKKVAVLATGLALAILVVFAVAASANFLKKGRASEANRIYTEGFCDGTQGATDGGGSPSVQCTDYSSGPCQRISRHRVDCGSKTIYGGGHHECSWKNKWTIKPGSNRLRHAIKDPGVVCIFF